MNPQVDPSPQEMLAAWKKALRAVRVPGETVRARHDIRRPLKRAKSPYRGVTWNSRGYGWTVRLKYEGRSLTFGFFKVGHEIEAARLYDRVARIYHGDQAVLNFPRRNERGVRDLNRLPV